MEPKTTSRRAGLSASAELLVTNKDKILVKVLSVTVLKIEAAENARPHEQEHGVEELVFALCPFWHHQ